MTQFMHCCVHIAHAIGQRFSFKININCCVSFLADQKQRKRNISQVLKPAAQQMDNSQSEMNIASGFPMFAKQGALDSNSYLHNDCMYLKCSAS